MIPPIQQQDESRSYPLKIDPIKKKPKGDDFRYQ